MNENLETLKLQALTLLREHPEQALFPGALFTGKGPQEYIGSTLALTGTIFFKDAHRPDVRNAICDCFEQYEVLARNQLTWLWRSEPSEGPDKISYRKAKPMRDLMSRMDEDDAVSFGYTSGKNPEDSGGWEFYVNGWRGWQAKMNTWGLCSLRFALPLLFVHDNPTALQSMFVKFAKRLQAVHGYAGPSLVLSLVRRDENEPLEAYMSEQMKGIDVGSAVRICEKVVAGIKTVSWLTAINNDMVKQLGGLTAIRSELPPGWFAFYDYDAGIVIQAGPKASLAAAAVDPLPAIYVLPNMLLREVRTLDIGSLHNGSRDGELRITGKAADDWLKRFDVPDDELMTYRRKLLDEPKLTPETTLREQL